MKEKAIENEQGTKLLERISVNPLVCHGAPCVKGTRIMVWLVVQCIANGDTVEKIRQAYPQLTKEDIKACLTYAAEMTRENIVPIKVA